MSAKKTGKNMDIGSLTTFKNVRNKDYSLSEQKGDFYKEESEQIVKIEIDKLEEAPNDWNFYPPLIGEEFERLVRSILAHGLLHPIVVEHREEKNIILSGHNRVRAYRYIRRELQAMENQMESSLADIDISEIKSESFREIFAIVKENLTPEDAREIIIDGNYAQRQLGPKLLTKSIIEKYKIIQDKRRRGEEGYKNKKTREIVAESFQMSGRHIDRYRKLEYLNQNLLELFFAGRISLEMGAKLAVMKPEIQEEIYRSYQDIIVKYPAQSMSYFKAGMTKKDLLVMKGEILEEKHGCRISFFQDGAIKHVNLYEKEEIEAVIRLVSSLQDKKRSQ